MTNKIYEKNSYLRELDTVVSECISENGRIYLKHRETIFFPEEGVQYSDTGVIIAGDKKIQVVKGELIGNASECETDFRYLVDTEEAVEPGTEVKCLLNWEQRFSRMQNHSGEHIISGLIHNIHGYNNIGFHLSDDEPVTLTVDGKLNADQIREIELKANEAVYADLPIIDTYPSKEEAAGAIYRSKIEIAGQVRLITIGDASDPLDVCACCAPHVARTGAIGIIKVIASAGIKEGTQLQILCGRRALVDDLRNENREFKNRLSILAETTMIEKAKSDISEGKCCVFTDIDLSPLSMKNIYNELLKMKKGYVGIFVGSDEEGYRYNAGGEGLDARILATKMRE